MPHYSDTPRHRAYLKRAIEGIQAQTDPDWQLVIVDDASPKREDREYLKALEAELAGKVVVLLQDENRGAGACRNVGICWAWEHGSEVVLFQDSDDICHPDRLKVSRAILEGSSEIDLVYSTFIAMDEDERPLARERLVPMVAEILDAHRTSPVEGSNAWIRIGTETGFMCPMSTVAVRTRLAMAHPFPTYRGSEDSHTWLRISAGGEGFAYAPSIPMRYRIPQQLKGSANYSRVGEHAYHALKVTADSDGFFRAIAIALGRRTIEPDQVDDLKRRFFLRLAETMRKDDQHDLARELVARASALEAS